MKIARYWKKGNAQSTLSGKPVNIAAWGWSETSPVEAEQRANEAAQRTARRIAAGEPFPDSYSYFDRPPREEILEEIKNDEGSTIGVVSRNAYGSLVLNSPDLMFIDIDIPSESSFAGLIRMVKRLFGQQADDNSSLILKKVAAFANGRPDLTLRVYRTAAGFRCAIVNRRFDPKSAESRDLFQILGADPLYVTLCQNQESFRARLTPKFWRCGAGRPPHRYPFETEAQQRNFDRWQREYDSRIGDFATCAFVQQLGGQTGTAEMRKLIDLHDKVTRAASGLRLA